MTNNFQTYFNSTENISYLSFNSMHTFFNMLITDVPIELGDQIFKKVFNEARRLNTKLSKFDNDGLLSIINEGAYSKLVEIDDEMIYILHDCFDLFLQTNKLFDISINSLTKIQDFFKKVEINEHLKTISLIDEHLKLDLGGYAKGYFLSVIKNILDNENVENSLVNFGNSSIYARGKHPIGECWVVAVPDYFNREESVLKFELNDKFLTISGRKYNQKEHIISPVTGKHISNFDMACVVSENPTQGEALTTAMIAAENNEVRHKLISCNKIPEAHYILYNPFGKIIENIEFSDLKFEKI